MTLRQWSQRDEYAHPRHRDWEMFIVALVVGAACLLLDTDSTRVQVRGLNFNLPSLCLSQSLFGIHCPGCGLTRSFVHLAHGRWLESWQCHRLGWALALMLALQIPYRAFRLAGGSGDRYLSLATRKIIGHVLVALLLLNWLAGFMIS